MSATLTPPRTRTIPTAADLLRRLGDIPPDRVRMIPPPGTATEADLLRYTVEDGTLYELVDGTLVEKAVGMGESKLAVWFLSFLSPYLREHPIGVLSAPDGHYRIRRKIVRAPDIAFCKWATATTPEQDATNPIAATVPDLVVEIVSRSNTPKELRRKRSEFFKAGTRLIWQVFPIPRTVHVYKSPTKPTILTVAATLDGGVVLPGFKLPLAELFNQPTGPVAPKKS